MEWWHVYLFTRLDGLSSACTVAFVLGCIGIVIAMIAGSMAVDWANTFGDESNPGWRKACLTLGKISLPTLIIGGILSIVIPTQKEAAAIYLLPKLSHSDFAKEAGQIPTEAAKLMRVKLESWISEIEPKAK